MRAAERISLLVYGFLLFFFHLTNTGFIMVAQCPLMEILKIGISTHEMIPSIELTINFNNITMIIMH